MSEQGEIAVQESWCFRTSKLWLGVGVIQRYSKPATYPQSALGVAFFDLPVLNYIHLSISTS